MRMHPYRLLPAILAVLMLAVSCSTTRVIPEGEYRLAKNDIEITNGINRAICAIHYHINGIMIDAEISNDVAIGVYIRKGVGIDNTLVNTVNNNGVKMVAIGRSDGESGVATAVHNRSCGNRAFAVNT